MKVKINQLLEEDPAGRIYYGGLTSDLFLNDLLEKEEKFIAIEKKLNELYSIAAITKLDAEIKPTNWLGIEYQKYNNRIVIEFDKESFNKNWDEIKQKIDFLNKEVEITIGE